MAIEKKMSRRRLVTLLSQAVAGLSLSACSFLSRRPESTSTSDERSPASRDYVMYDCIIIGAGISGLTLAKQLRSKSVLVLEASDRIGGRIYTDRSTFARQVECGAEYVHMGPLSTPLWRDLYEYHLKMHVINKNDGYMYHPEIKKSKAVSAIKAAFSWGIFKALRIFNAVKYRGPDDISAEEYLANYARKHSDDKNTLGLDFRRMVLSGHLGAPEELMSMKGFRYDHIPEQLEGKKEYYVRNGFGALTDNMAHGLNIRTNQSVKRVVRNGDIIEIETVNGMNYHARSVCYTASVGVLKSGALQFVPSLPESKLAAIAHLDMSHHTKIQLEFAKAFWPKDMSMLNRVDQGRRVGKTYFVAHTENTEALPMLTALIMGHDAMKLYNRKEEDVIRDICLDLQECLPKGEDVFALLNRDSQGKLAIKMTHWNENPYTRGGISYIKKDLANPIPIKEVRKYYASPSETPGIFWAGEAAAVYEQPASVHGAHSAGLRASIEILNYLDGKEALSPKKLAKAYHQKFGIKKQMDWYPEISREPSLPYDDENSWYEKCASLIY